MRSLQLLVGSALLVVAVAVSPRPAEAVAAKSGAVCKTGGAKSGSLTCTKGSKGLRWKRVVAKPSASTAVAGNPATETTSAKPAPVASSAAPTTAPTAVATQTRTRAGLFAGAAGYRAAGTVDVVETGSSASMRIRNAAIQSGPALVLYLTPEPGALNLTGAIRVAPLTSLTGSSEYVIPNGTEVDSFGGVLIWCDRFAVPFGTAELR